MIRRVRPFYSYGGGAAPWSDYQEYGLDMDGVTEWLRFESDRTAGDDRIGVGNNVWSIQFWCLPDIIAANDYYFFLCDWASTTKNKIALYSAGSTSSYITIYNTAGTEFKRYYMPGPVCPPDQLWSDWVFTWDGTNLKCYLNGFDLESVLTKSVNNAGTMDTNVYECAVGATTSQSAVAKLLNAFSLAVWSTALSAAEVAAIHNGGLGGQFNLAADSGNYTSSATLSNWWRLGKDVDPALGKEYITESSDLDLITLSGGITDADRVNTYPNGVDDLKRSIDFDGVTERLMSLNSTDVGCNNDFTVAMWIWPDIVAAGDYFFDMNDGSNNNRMAWLTVNNNTTWLLLLYENDGTLFKYWLEDAITDRAWQLMAASWDGTNLVMSINGVELVGQTKTIDNAGTMDGNIDTITLGNAYSGNLGALCNIHACGVWDEALGLAELVALYNAGDGINAPFDTNKGNYTSAANLIRWFRPGYDIGNIGIDYVDGGIDLMDNAVAITYLDIDPEAPFV